VHLVLPNEEVALRAGKAGMVDACTVRKEKREARDQRWADRGPGEDSILSGLTSLTW